LPPVKVKVKIGGRPPEVPKIGGKGGNTRPVVVAEADEGVAEGATEGWTVIVGVTVTAGVSGGDAV